MADLNTQRMDLIHRQLAAIQAHGTLMPDPFRCDTKQLLITLKNGRKLAVKLDSDSPALYEIILFDERDVGHLVADKLPVRGVEDFVRDLLTPNGDDLSK
jgi:hypothetical protein